MVYGAMKQKGIYWKMQNLYSVLSFYSCTLITIICIDIIKFSKDMLFLKKRITGKEYIKNET